MRGLWYDNARMLPYRLIGFYLCLLWVLLACQPSSKSMTTAWQQDPSAPVDVRQRPVVTPIVCEGHFIAHTLPFSNGVRMREIRTYESNGAGVAVNDLNGNGKLDLVFAGIDRDAVILWNQGDLTFTQERLPAMFTRAVNVVDVDGDGLLDIVFTHRGLNIPSFWRNQGVDADPHFAQAPLPGVTAYAYSMAWGDVNGSGLLDLVTGSYNVELKEHGIAEPQNEPSAGVHVYEQRGDGFSAARLTGQAESLAVALVDLNEDAQLDIWVANDFVVRDQFWLRGAAVGPRERTPSWVAGHPFRQTSHSTMSIDWGDITNSGAWAYLTTDMNPDDLAVTTLAAWLPVTSKLEQPRGAHDPQIMANVLQAQAPGGGWQNAAPSSGIDATGWSWAGKFGDLDNDGFLDLYIVNGMIAENLFAHLPNAELVEENRAFRNRGDGRFTPAPSWMLGSTASGRGMVMADLDGDGDLDIVVNNLRGSAQLFENRLCAGHSLQVDLRWPGSANTRAVGAQLRLTSSHGAYLRDVRSSSGYLSGDPARVHIGFPADATLAKLEIRWPDGVISELTGLTPNTLLEVTR